MAIVLIVLNPTLMMVDGDLLMVAVDSSHLRMAEVNLLKAVGNLMAVVDSSHLRMAVDNLNLMAVVDNNLLKAANKNLLVVDDLITLHLRIQMVASR